MTRTVPRGPTKLNCNCVSTVASLLGYTGWPNPTGKPELTPCQFDKLMADRLEYSIRRNSAEDLINCYRVAANLSLYRINTTPNFNTYSVLTTIGARRLTENPINWYALTVNTHLQIKCMQVIIIVLIMSLAFIVCIILSNTFYNRPHYCRTSITSLLHGKRIMNNELF